MTNSIWRKRRSAYLLVFTLILIIGISVAAFYHTNKQDSLQDDSALYKSVSASKNSGPSFSSWQQYNNEKDGYHLKIPHEWKIDVEFRNLKPTGKVVFSQGIEKIGNLDTIEVTTLHRDTDAVSIPDFLEIESTQVSQIPARVFLDKEASKKNAYRLITWVKAEKVNYLISVRGSQKLTKDDVYAYKNILSTFRLLN